MNTEAATDIADVWNALFIDKGHPPWVDLTPERQAEQTGNWERLNPHDQYRLRRRARGGLTPPGGTPARDISETNWETLAFNEELPQWLRDADIPDARGDVVVEVDATEREIALWCMERREFWKWLDAKIAEVLARPSEVPFKFRPTKEVADHNRAMLIEALKLARRGYAPLPAGRPHSLAGSTRNLRHYNRDAREGKLHSPEFIDAQRKGAKLPLGIEWQLRASSDPETIWENFQRYPRWDDYPAKTKRGERWINFEVNLCIATGLRHGYFALDVDGEQAREKLRQLEEKYGKLPHTVQSISGSGQGDHYIFNCPPGVELRNTASRFGTGGDKSLDPTNLDIRGYHGQIIVSPSLHKSGNTYDWVNSALDTRRADPLDWVVNESNACSPKAQREAKERDGTASSPAKKTTEEDEDIEYTKPRYADGTRGWRNHVSRIGYGEGTAGCIHYAINSAALSFFRERGTDGATAELAAEIIERLKVVTAERPDKQHYLQEVDDHIKASRSDAVEWGWEALKAYVYGGLDEAIDKVDDLPEGDMTAAQKQAKIIVQCIGVSGFDATDLDTLAAAIAKKTTWRTTAIKKDFADSKRKAKNKLSQTGRLSTDENTGLPEGFEVADDFTQRKVLRGDKEEWVTVCSAIRNLGFLYDENGQGHGHLIEAVDRLGNKRQIGFEHAETVRDVGAFLGRLAKEGNIWFDGTTAAHGHAVTLFSRLPVAEQILNASKAGFHTYRDTLVYIPPVGEPIGVHEGRVRLQEASRLPKTEPRGTLEGWRASAAELVAISDFHAPMILSAGFAGVIVALCCIPSCGMGFTGTSSVGKSLSMKIAAAASSAVRDAAGLFMSANGTTTGQELSVAQGNGATFFLDEIKLLPVKAIQSILFMLAEGQGRVRGTAAVTRAKTATWSSYFVYSGELEIEKLIALGDDTKAGGLDRRFPEVDTSGAKGCDEDARVKALEARVDDNYGHALPAFVQWLFDRGYTQDRDRLLQMITAKMTELLGKEGTEKPPAVRAAAFNVAIANVAGLLAREAGVMPDVDIDAAFRTGWARSLGAEGASFAGDAKAAVVDFWGQFSAVFHMHGVVLNGDPGAVASLPDNVPLHRKHLFYMGSALQHEGRRYVVIRDDPEADKLLIKGGVKRDAVFREMGGAFIKHGKNRVWTDMPKECGGGPGKHFRILLPESFVIPDDGEQDEQDGE